MKVEVAVLGSPSLIVVLNMVSVDVKQHFKKKKKKEKKEASCFDPALPKAVQAARTKPSHYQYISCDP